MKDAYSFDIDQAGLDHSYELHDAAYRAIFTRCGLEFVAVDADSGAMGGSQSQEFMVYTDAGEDLIASSPVTGYAANIEKATSRLRPVVDLEPTGDGLPELVHTPGKASIADVAEFFQILPAQDIKCVAYMAEVRDAKGNATWQPVAAFLRGDHTVNETKLLGAIKGAELRTMNGDELAQWLHGPAGYLGPIGLDPAKQPHDGKLTVVVDAALEGRKNLVCGANQLDHHYRNVTPGRDFTWTVLSDIRNAVEGEQAPDAQEGVDAPLRIGKAVEIGHIFKLGYRYAEALGAKVLDRNGKEVTPIMGSYGIGIERILTAAIESSAAANANLAANDPKASGEQYALSAAIAPYQCIVTITNIREADLLAAGEKVAAALDAAGVDTLLDDRDERAGVKFKDAELIGVPYRINIGKKLSEGLVELVDRITHTTTDLPVDSAAEHVRALITSKL
jgi:prolyl-tRNA synthetase